MITYTTFPNRSAFWLLSYLWISVFFYIFLFTVIAFCPSASTPLFGKPPSLQGCMDITQHERNSLLISAHNLPMQRTPYALSTHTHTHTHRHTPTHKTQATPWGLVLRCNFLSIKISFLSCCCHDNAPWRSCSLVKSNEVSRYCCGLPVTPDP